MTGMLVPTGGSPVRLSGAEMRSLMSGAKAAKEVSVPGSGVMRMVKGQVSTMRRWSVILALVFAGSTSSLPRLMAWRQRDFGVGKHQPEVPAADAPTLLTRR